MAHVPLNVLLIEPEPLERNWIEHAILATKIVTRVGFPKGGISKIQWSELSDVQLIVIQDELLPAFYRFLKKHSSITELHFSIIVLLGTFQHYDLSKYSDLTIDTFSKYILTPNAFSHAITSVIRDHENNRKLHQLAHYDNLTGATNRVLFNDRLKQSISRRNRYSEALSVFFLDLNKFKLVNDTYGHDVGDLLLKKFVSLVKRCLRDSDTLARLGGDEFSIISPNTDKESAKNIADKILNALEKKQILNGHSIQIGVAIGIVCITRTALNKSVSSKLIKKKSDEAAYISKSKPGNNYEFVEI